MTETPSSNTDDPGEAAFARADAVLAKLLAEGKLRPPPTSDEVRAWQAKEQVEAQKEAQRRMHVARTSIHEVLADKNWTERAEADRDNYGPNR